MDLRTAGDVFQVVAHQLVARLQVEPFHHLPDMVFDGIFADMQVFADLLVAHALGQARVLCIFMQFYTLRECIFR